MELFKSLDDLTKLDEKHELMSMLNGYTPSLEDMHKYLTNEELNAEVPESIQGQFNKI